MPGFENFRLQTIGFKLLPDSVPHGLRPDAPVAPGFRFNEVVLFDSNQPFVWVFLEKSGFIGSDREKSLVVGFAESLDFHFDFSSIGYCYSL